jgi:hypothetical protein
MAQDFTIVFKAAEDETEIVLGGIDVYDIQECSDISELVRFSESLKEPETSTFLMG